MQNIFDLQQFPSGKNIRNNLLNSQKIVFPAFCFSIENAVMALSQGRCISYKNFKEVHEEDAKLKANLRKAPKLTYKVLTLEAPKNCVT